MFHLSSGQLIYLPFTLSVSETISQSTLKVKTFESVTSSRTFLFFLSQLHSSSVSVSLPSPSSSGSTSRVFQMAAVSTFPLLQLHFCLVWLSLSVLSLLFSLLCIRLYWLIPSFNYCFHKMSHRFFPGEQGSTVTTRFAVCAEIE